MRFLVDKCAGRRLAQWLRERGHDVAESRDLGQDPGDRALLQHSFKEQRVLVTMDKDFGEILFLERHPHCGLVRLPDVPSSDRIALFEQILAHHAEALSGHAIVTVRGGRIRVSWAPSTAV